jgi:hypothetical protein
MMHYLRYTYVGPGPVSFSPSLGATCRTIYYRTDQLTTNPDRVTCCECLRLLLVTSEETTP